MKRYIVWIASALVAVTAVVAIAAHRSGKPAEEQTANFTVEFHNGELEYIINGYETVALSDVLKNLGIESSGEISKVTFSDPSLIAVAEEAGDWSLKSLAPFSTHENLSIAYADGRVLDMEVTDGFDIDVTWSGSKPDGINASYNVTMFGTRKPIMRFYDESGKQLGECQANDNVTILGWFSITSPGNKYWFEVTSTEHLNLNYIIIGEDLFGASISSGIIGSYSGLGTPVMNVTCHSTAIKNGDGFKVKHISELTLSTARIYTRNIKIFIDGVQDGDTISQSFPGRDNGGDYNPLSPSDIILYDLDNTKYASYNVTVDENTKTYTINLLTKYSVKFNGNGSTSGSMSNQNFVWDTEQNLTENAYKKEYTVTFDGNGGTPAASSLTSSASFSGWEDRSTFVYPDDGSTWTCSQFDAPFYANFYTDLKTVFGYNKYKLLDHYIKFGQGEGRLGAGDTPGVYSDKELVGNLSSTKGGVVPLYAVWAPQPAVTLPSATRTGYVFEGWYTAAEGGTKAGDAGAAYMPIGNVTLYGQWRLESFDLTINETGLSGKDGIIVTVTASGSSKPAYVVSLDAAKPSVTIKAIPAGTYDIVETGWSHAYTVDTASYNKNIDNNTEVTFAHTPKDGTPLHAEDSVNNWGNTTE